MKNSTELYGPNLTASDGEIGCVKDFYFDDKMWVICYLDADTGSWLRGRPVLPSPHALGRVDRNEKRFEVNLAQKQIERSPSIERHEPVSPQYEGDYYHFHGWRACWNGGALSMQPAPLHRARCNVLPVRGKYSLEIESITLANA